MFARYRTKTAIVYIATFLVAILFSLAAAFVEYFSILAGGLPLREARAPAFLNLYVYDWILFLPVLGLLSFSPVLYIFFYRLMSAERIRRHLAFGVGTLLLGWILKDAGYFFLRAIVPLSTDPLAHQWIRSSDFTASFLGYAQIFSLTIPLWYIAYIPVIVAVFVSLLINGPSPQFENTLSAE